MWSLNKTPHCQQLRKPVNIFTFCKVPSLHIKYFAQCFICYLPEADLTSWAFGPELKEFSVSAVLQFSENLFQICVFSLSVCLHLSNKFNKYKFELTLSLLPRPGVFWISHMPSEKPLMRTPLPYFSLLPTYGATFSGVTEPLGRERPQPG